MPDMAPSALVDLVRFLRQSQDTIGLIKIPVMIEDGVKRHLLPQATMSTSYVEAIVAALDHQEPSLCSRLDLHAFIIVYLILSKAKDGAAQQRGLALLTESLHYVSSPRQDASLGLEKKIRLGQKALSFLIQTFGNQKRMSWTRRWMGIFALELLSGCDENKTLLLNKAQESWRSIGRTIINGTCETLKLVAGLLIIKLWPGGPPTEANWFSERDLAIYASFPSYIKHPSPRWIVDFGSFIDVLHSKSFLSETRSGIFLAYGVSIADDLTYGWEDQSAILVTVSTELNIVVWASETGPARYIDILHDQIESVSLEKRHPLSQSNPLVLQNLDFLVIWLTRSSDKTLYLDAGKRFAPLINIAFTSTDEATAVKNRLLELAPHIFEKLTCSESEPLSLFQPTVGKIEEHRILCDPAAQVDTNRPAIVTTSTESVSLSTFIPNPEPDFTRSFLNWPKNISTGLPRTTNMTDLRSDTGISLEDIQTESVASRSYNPTKYLEDMSEGSLRNSAEWRKGAMLIDTAPELRDTHERVMESGKPFGKGISSVWAPFIKRAHDHNSFCDEPSKGQDTNAEHAEQPRTHNEGLLGLQQPLGHDLGHKAKTRDMNENLKAETSRMIAVGVAESDVQDLEKNEHVNGNTAEIRELAAVSQKLPATNASEEITFGKNQADRKAESLSVKVSRFQGDENGEDEFDFPLSPWRARTPKNAQRLIPGKVQSGEGAIGPAPAGINRDEEPVIDNKANGADTKPVRERLPRGKAKSAAARRSKNKDEEAFSSKKGLGGPMRKTNQKTRSAPLPAPQPRSRRAAALIANQRIKNFVHGDTSQEQSRGEVNYDVEISRPKPSQEAYLPNTLASNNPNIDRGRSQKLKLYMRNGMQKTGTAEGLGSALETSDSHTKSHTGFTSTSSMTKVDSKKSHQFGEAGGERPAFGAERPYRASMEEMRIFRATMANRPKYPFERGDACSKNLKGALSSVADVDRSLKRKLPLGGGDLSESETDLVHGKRPEKLAKAPRVQDVRYRGSVITDAPHTPSSRGSRVNGKGNPMPSSHSRDFTFRDDGGYDSSEIGTSPGLSSDDEQDDLLEPDISALRTRLSKAMMESWRESSSNSKDKRDFDGFRSINTSPLTAGMMHPNGELTNVHTETPVIPIEPAIMSISNEAHLKPSFIEMLRGSNHISEELLQGDVVGLPGQDPNEDLIENQTESPSAAGWSSGSSSYNSRPSSSERSSDDKGRSYRKNVRAKTLDPHQKAQLDALYKVSDGVVAALNKSEKRINKRLLANKRKGMRLVNEFGKARKQDVQAFKEKTDKSNKELIKKLKEEVVELRSNIERLRLMPVADLEKDWEDEQRENWAKTEAVLAASSK